MNTALVIALLCLYGYFGVTHGGPRAILQQEREADYFEENIRTDNKRSLSGIRKAFSYLKGAAMSGDKVFASRGDIAYWVKAKSICNSHGGQLAMPRTSEENQAVLSIQKQFGKTSFLGFSNKRSDSQFRDVFGIGISYTNWQRGQPDNSRGQEQCVQMWTSGEWNDIRCADRLLVVCEYE